ncbi:2396_t:CDS:2 [Cetraspora pellucida]|uniref:2396_t:CDS:1 n=1 Tax=Cetraspora pellucida TaxID=1433469 RepID=A0A9N9BKB0_9GLOM|nr:2396_t:CDS:2 [Cetraspora pellucida]
MDQMIGITPKDFLQALWSKTTLKEQEEELKNSVPVSKVSLEPLLVKNVKTVTVKRKKVENNSLQISALVFLYFIIVNICDKSANITFEQLLYMVSFIQTELFKSLHKKKAIAKRT